jgi:predicted dehydrogenase
MRDFAELKGHNVEVAALCDVDESILNERVVEAEELTGKKPQSFFDVRKLLEDKEIDAVSFATPNHWHALNTVWACQAGKDVYVEKPSSHGIWEGRKMVEAARKYGRIVQVGTQNRSSPALQEAMEKIRKGLIGDVYMARGLCFKWRKSIGKAKVEPIPPGVHYDLWIGPAPSRPFTRNRFHYEWHWHWDYGNGDIGNQGSHQLDLARWGLGVGLPEKVQCMGGHYLFEDDQETPNVQVTAFEYPEEKKLLTFEVRHWITNSEGDSQIGVFIYGSDGYVEIPKYSAYRSFLGRKREPGPAREEDGNHYVNFIDAMRTRKPEQLNADIEEGHISSSLAHLANIAYRTGRTLKFDPRQERFPHDQEANQYLKRRYRPPFVVPDKV